MLEAHCPLCGVLLEAYDGDQPPESKLSWLAEIRAGEHYPPGHAYQTHQS
jgi:hypothetical protein